MKRTADERAFYTIGIAFIVVFSILCLFPFLTIISGSLSSEKLVKAHGYSVLPRGFTFSAYQSLFKKPETILRAYALTIAITGIGIVLSLSVNSMTAYALHRRDFTWRNHFALFFYFTCLFSGGMVPSYILHISLGMRNNPVVLVIGSVFSVWNAFLIRNYMSTLPDSLMESAKIDGAGDFTIYMRITLPLCTPVLATMALFTGLGIWNSWYNAMLYLSDKSLYPLQYVLYQLLNSSKARELMMKMDAVVDFSTLADLPEETLKLAATVVVTGPVIFAYPFVQKYFVKGITIGAVKG